MALKFQEQENVELPEWDFSGLGGMAEGIKDKIGYGEGQWAPGKYAAGLVGGAWDKWKTRGGEGDDDELSAEERLKKHLELKAVSEKSSIASDIGGVLSGAWKSLTGGREEGEVTTGEVVPGYSQREGDSISSLTDVHKLIGSGTIKDYSQIPEHYRSMLDENTFNQLVSGNPDDELSSMITRPDTYAGQDYNSMSGKGPLKNKQGIFGMLTGPFNINKYSQ
jgi:hypothetical protein